MPVIRPIRDSPGRHDSIARRRRGPHPPAVPRGLGPGPDRLRRRRVRLRRRRGAAARPRRRARRRAPRARGRARAPRPPPRPASSRPRRPCDDGDDDPTDAQTEGPYYTPNTPRRSNLVTAGLRGIPLLVTGDVVDTQCRPVRGALLDFWQADAAGQLRQPGLPPARAPVRRRARALRAADDRPGPLPRPHPPHPRQGAAPAREDPHDAALLPRRAAQPQRQHLRQLAADGRPPRRQRPPGALPVRR